MFLSASLGKKKQQQPTNKHTNRKQGYFSSWKQTLNSIWKKCKRRIYKYKKKDYEIYFKRLQN